MADWFVSMSPFPYDDGQVEVFECIEYRDAVRLAHKLCDDDKAAVEVIDYEGRVVRSIGLDRFDGTQGFSGVPLRAGIYRWEDGAEAFREVMR